MKPLNITLSDHLFAAVQSGAKRIVSTKRNPRKDRYFAAKKPTEAKINGSLFKINNIAIDSDCIHLYIS